MGATGQFKCPICLQYFDSNKIDSVFIRGRHYHRSCCSQDFIYQETILDFLKSIWGNCNRIKIMNQIVSMQKEYGYTTEQIYKDLEYFFKVKKNDATIYQNTIKIVPYIHNEAQKYYKILESKENKKEYLIQMLETFSEKSKVFYVNKQQKRKKSLFELEIEEEGDIVCR